MQMARTPAGGSNAVQRGGRERVTEPFRGFPDEAFVFYEGLEADNSKTYWTAHKATYDDQVRSPMLALVAELAPEFGTASLFRPYRDVRFARDKSPYKTHQGAFAATAPGVGYYVQVSADGLLVAAGFYSHGADQVERYRAAVDDDVTGRRLQDMVSALKHDGFDIGGDALKTRPKGYPTDHPRIELLRYRSLYAERSWPPEPWIHTPGAASRVREAWTAARPLVEWITEHVGPTHEAARR
jgi:uncharacterized protein (TIGR02453 family)